MEIAEGSVFEHKRVFTRDQILQFAEITRDYGEHHTYPIKKVMAHGLLVASIVTKIGGDMNYLSSEMTIKFLQPVYEEEEITGRLTLQKVEDKKLRKKIVMLCEIIKADGSLAVTGESRGQILKSEQSEVHTIATS